jgi:Ca2+-transporting ATPase
MNTSQEKCYLFFHIPINTCLNSILKFNKVFNEVNSRDMEKINVFKGLFSSWIFVMVIASTVCFQVIIVEFLGTFAQTVPLSRELWLTSVMIGAVSLVVAVVLKCIPVPVKNYVATHHDGYEQLPSGPELA